MFRIKQVARIFFFRLFPLRKIRGVLSAKQKKEGIPRFLLIRRHPDLNWGKRICSPPPYRSAMPPEWYEIDENLPPLLGVAGPLNFFFYCTFILNPIWLHPRSERLSSFFALDPSLPSVVCIVSQNRNISKLSLSFIFVFSIFSISIYYYYIIYWKNKMCFFRPNSQNSG